jgi:hypothetical protein
MTEGLRPSTLGEILDRTFQLYRNHFWRFVGVAALPLLLTLVLVLPALAIFAIPGIALGVNAQPMTMIRGVAFALAYLVLVPVYVGAYAFSIAGITEGAVLAQRGEVFTIRSALKRARPRFWTYTWYFSLQGILALLAPMLAAGILIGPLIYLMMRSGLGIGPGIALGFLVFLLGTTMIGVIAWLCLSFAMGMAACVVEKKPAWESVKRSWRLSHGTHGRLFVLYLLISTLKIVVVMMSYFLAFVLIAVISVAGQSPAIAAVAIAIGGIVYLIGVFGTQMALLPLPWIALTLFYFDQRIRKEGYDIEWMMQQAGLTPPETAPIPATDAPGFPPVTPPDTLREP